MDARRSQRQQTVRNRLPNLRVVLKLVAAASLLGCASASYAQQAPGDVLDQEIARLISQLSDPRKAEAAADALAGYGTDAQAAVPEIIRQLADTPTNRIMLRNVAEHTLQHVGPPHVSAVPELCQLLEHESYAVQQLSARALALLGPDGKDAAPTLERAIDQCLAQYQRELGDGSTFDDETIARLRPITSACGNQISALWHVTHDAPRMLSKIDDCLRLTKDSPWLGAPSDWDLYRAEEPWRQFSHEQLLLLRPFLYSFNIDRQLFALSCLDNLGERAKPLREDVRQIADFGHPFLADSALRVLSQFGPEMADDVAPILLKRYQALQLPLYEFCTFATQMHVRDERVLAIIRPGMEGDDGHMCVGTLMRLLPEPEREELALTLLNPNSQHVPNAFSRIDFITRYQPNAEIAVPMLIELAQESTMPKPQMCAEALANYGPQAKAAIPRLKYLFQHDEAYASLPLACAIYKISGDTTELDLCIQMVNASDDFSSHVHMIQALAELNADIAPFEEYLLDRAGEDNSAWVCQHLTQALAAAGTPNTLAALEELSQSKDWAKSQFALRALKSRAESSRMAQR